MLAAAAGIMAGAAADSARHASSCAAGVLVHTPTLGSVAASLPRFIIGVVALLVTRAVVKALALPAVLAVARALGAAPGPGHAPPAPSPAPTSSPSASPTSGPDSLSRLASTVVRRVAVEGDGYSEVGALLSKDVTPRASASSADKANADKDGGAGRLLSHDAEDDARAPPSWAEANPLRRYAVELPVKFFTYGAVGFNAIYTVPRLVALVEAYVPAVGHTL
jgi:hypothetical protein